MPSNAVGSAREGRVDAGNTPQPLRARPGLSGGGGLVVALLLVATTARAWAAPQPSVAPEPRMPVGGETSRHDDPPTPRATFEAQPPTAQPVLRTVVTSRRAPPGAGSEDLTATASVLIPAESRRAVDDLGTLLLEVPGANVTRRGGLGSLTTLSLRGSNPEEVRLYVDGVPMNQAVGGAVDLSTLPLGDVERIEVYRGSSPIVFGQSALGGVVSISTQTPGPARASLRAGAGSFGTVFGSASAGGQAGPLRLYAGVHTLRVVGDYPVAAPDEIGGYRPSTRENNDLRQWDGVLRATLPLAGRRELRAGFLGVARQQGVPVQDNFQGAVTQLHSARGVAHLGYESRDDLGDGGRLRALLYVAAMRQVFSDPLGKVAGQPTATDDLSRTLGGTVTAEKALGSWARLVTMVEGRGEDYTPRNGADSSVPMGHPARRQAGAAGLELTIPWRAPGIDLVPSGRVELFRDVRTSGEPGGASAPTERALPVFRLGLLRAFAPASPDGMRPRLTANVGRYARIPSFVELYGYNRGIVGNPLLLPERGWNADLGASLSRGELASSSAFLASLTVFAAAVEDLIAWRTYTYQTRPENISRARVWGVEAEVRARVGRLGTTAQATLTDARDRGDVAASAGRQIAHHPRYRGYARLEWRQPMGPLVWSAYADADGTAGAYVTATPYGALPPRLLTGAGLVAEHPRSGLRVAASGLNLGDSQVHDFPGYPQPGRSIFVSVGWSPAAELAPNSPTP